MFCANCGKEIDDKAVVCIGCGCEVKKREEDTKYSWVATLLLCFFLGTLGIHRFYTNHTGSAILQLILSLTFIGLIITIPWVIIDFIMILANGFEAKGHIKLTK